jgi:prolyl 4-hydroxylase
MQMLVHFSPELKDWLSQNLARGCAHATVVDTMTAQGFAPPVAAGLVAAFARALMRGDALPDGAVTLEVEDDAAPGDGYRSDPSRLAPGHRICADGRDVDVLMRLACPRIAVLGNVLSAEECAAVITLGTPRLAPSTVVDPGSGADLAAAHRSSEGMFFDLCEDALIARIDRRVSELMGLPLAHGEGLQLLRYRPGCASSPHHDFLVPQNDANRASIARSGQRVSTLVMYLNDVPAGGATVFPGLGLEVAPRRGHGVYFEYANAAGQLDQATLHAGAPVELGEKWVLTKWMRARPFVAAGPAKAAAIVNT